MSEGRSSEVSIAGCEGMVGIGLLGDLNRSVHSAVYRSRAMDSAFPQGAFVLPSKIRPPFREAITRLCDPVGRCIHQLPLLQDIAQPSKT